MNSSGDNTELLIHEFDEMLGLSASSHSSSDVKSSSKAKSRSISSNSAYSVFEKLKEYKSQKDRWVLISFSSLILSGLNFLGLLFVGVAAINLASRPLPTLVQLSDGKVVNVAPLGSKERTNAVIQRFTVETLTGLMSWTNQIQSPDGKVVADPGVNVRINQGSDARQSGSYTLPTSVWRSSFAFSESFRQSLLGEIGNLIPAGVARGTARSALVINTVTVPKRIKEGEWEISIVADLVITDAGLSRRIPFNKIITVQAVDTPPLDMVNLTSLGNPLQRDILLARKDGLEITSMKDII